MTSAVADAIGPERFRALTLTAPGQSLEAVRETIERRAGDHRALQDVLDVTLAGSTRRPGTSRHARSTTTERLPSDAYGSRVCTDHTPTTDDTRTITP